MHPIVINLFLTYRFPLTEFLLHRDTKNLRLSMSRHQVESDPNLKIVGWSPKQH